MATDRDEIDRLTAAVSDSQEVDWSDAGGAAYGAEEARIVRNLAFLSRVAEANRQVMSQAEGLPFVTWGHLRLMERIGSGGYGEVYRAWEDVLHREVALKLFRGSSGETAPGQLDRLLEEARLLAGLRQENLVRVHGAEVHHGRVGFWMEFIQGETVEELLSAHGPLDAMEATHIGIKLALALGALHAAGVLHRDIKAANVIREVGGHLYLVDLGASATDSEDAIQREGTPQYMAPEALLEGRSSKQSDIYSLGTLLFYCVTRRFPVEGEDLEQVRANHQAGVRRTLGELRPNLPLAFRRAVERCVDPDPAKRFANASEVEDALSEVSSGRPGRARWVNIALVSVLVGIVGVQVFRNRVGAPRPSNTENISVLVLPFEVHGQQEGAEYVGRVFAEAIAVRLAEVPSLRVFPVAAGGEGSQSSEMTAERVIRGRLMRQYDGLQVSLSVVDVDANRIVWGTQEALQAADLTSAASRLSCMVLEGMDIPRPRLYPVPGSMTGPPEMASSPELAAVIGFLRQEKDAEADSVAAQLVGKFPAEPDAIAMQAWTRLRLWWRYHAEATRATIDTTLERLVQLDPGNPYAQMFTAFLLRHEGEPNEAITLYEQILTRQDMSSEFLSWVLRQRSNAYIVVGYAVEAERDLRRALELDPTAPESRMALSRVLRQLRRNEEAVECALHAVSLAPRDFEAYATAGIALEKVTRWDEANRYFEKAIELNSSQFTHSLLAANLAALGRREESARAIAIASTHPDEPYGCYNLALASERLGERDQALHFFRRAISAGYAGITLDDDEPGVEGLFSDPRFQALMNDLRRRMKED